MKSTNSTSAAEKPSATPAQLESLYTLGFELYHSEYYYKAVDLFRLLCFYDPSTPRNWIALGAASQRAKQHDNAVSAFLTASFVDPQSPEPKLYAAHSFIDIKDLRSALNCVQAAIQLCHGKMDKKNIEKNAIALRDALKIQLQK